MRYKYIILNEENIADGYIDTFAPMDFDTHILIGDEDAEQYLGKRYNDGVWEEVPEEVPEEVIE